MSSAIGQVERWRTRQPEKTVLAVVHNVTSAIRLTEILTVLDSDPRVQIVFTVTGSSAFGRGIDAYLERLGAHALSWAEAITSEFDLAIATSYGGDLAAIRAPLVTLPHGIGYNKLLEPSNHRTIEPSNHRIFRSSACRRPGWHRRARSSPMRWSSPPTNNSPAFGGTTRRLPTSRSSPVTRASTG
ncbi:hypothetical protein [Cryptosporangium aurantiacum]|uniref:hypothetical protein n=1 Tax=Cryptosporangium aurantiacum TaxID=134849 RepID=UPI001FE5A89C|nr:hypothetical protein [Cryptosporangium aurantiacum]